MSEAYKRNPNTECVVCAKAIYRRPGEFKTNQGNVFCNQGCYGLSIRKEHPCLVCGTLILAGANSKTCSRGCANRHRTGIKYKLNRPRDKVRNQRSLKIRLLDQRGVCCERCCCDVIEILIVHHRDRNREHNELTNLELLCPNCHAKEHYSKNSWLTYKNKIR